MNEIKRNPRVSVIVPNYNYADYLPRRLDSIREQTFRDFEVLVIDDASSDSSPEIISRYLEDQRFRAVFRKENSGNLFINWNLGVKKARGEYIWIAESDDYADHRFLEVMVSNLDQNPSVGLAYCQSVKVDEKGEVKGSMIEYTSDIDHQRWSHSFINSGPDECVRYLIYKNTIPNASAVVFRKKVYVEAGYADESIGYGNDWLTWVSISQLCDISFIHLPLNYFREHSRSSREEMDMTENEIMGSFQVLEYILTRMKVERKIKKVALNRRVQGWVNIFFRAGKKPDWRLNREIFSLVRSFDPLIYFRFSRELILFPFKISLAKLISLLGKVKG